MTTLLTHSPRKSRPPQSQRHLGTARGREAERKRRLLCLKSRCLGGHRQPSIIISVSIFARPQGLKLKEAWQGQGRIPGLGAEFPVGGAGLPYPKFGGVIRGAQGAAGARGGGRGGLAAPGTSGTGSATVETGDGRLVSRRRCYILRTKCTLA